MKKTFLTLIFLSFLCFPKALYAGTDENFDISVKARYEVAESGVTSITQNISIRNKKDFIYTPSYSIAIGLRDLENIQAFSEDGSIPFTLIDDKKEEKSIKVNFKKRFTGVNTSNDFTIKFDTNDIAFRKNGIWEISIPGLSQEDSFSDYAISLTVPESFGQASIIKPKKAKSSSLTFSKAEVGNAGVIVVFGENQFYNFILDYNISNPNFYPAKTELALPPSTNYQQVLLTSITPKPINVFKDVDGNWIAEYKLLPQQKQVVQVKGLAKILSKPNPEQLSPEQRKLYTAQKAYWDVTNTKIQKLAKELKTPEKIYGYVVKTLEYDYEKVASKTNRLGALGALSNTKNDVCLEFSDLFVALARAAGIPARSLEGYAYTDNDKLRPLSLVEDVLHAWPEYYDESAKTWIMVDPTWGNTTKGVDFFHTLDFEHIVFAIKGSDSAYPIPAGGYKFEKPTKDVQVSFAKKEEFKQQKSFELHEDFPSYSFFNFPLRGNITVKNTGNTPIQNEKMHVVTSFSKEVTEYTIDYIPPFGEKVYTLEFNQLPFLTKGNYTLTISLNDKVLNKSIAFSFFPEAKILVIGGVILIGAILTFIITIRTGGLLIQRRNR